MRILIACEFSGIVREAFIKQGHNAVSCDLLPTEIPGFHYKGDVRDIIREHWNMMIAFPPCTHLAVSGARYFKNKVAEQKNALDFIRLLKPDQIIQPWMFGHPESKATCLWLKNLPKLVPTEVLQKPSGGRWQNQTPSGQNKLGPSPDRWKERSRTYLGIAKAMAEQWGCI